MDFLKDHAFLTEWINAFAALVGALAVVAGLYGAKSTLDNNRRAAREMRRSQIAEELISLSFNAQDTLRMLRNPLDSIPVTEPSNKTYTYQKRYERLIDANDLFNELREAQIRMRAVIGDKQVDDAVDVFFKARTEIAEALKTIAEEAQRDHAGQDKESREFLRDLRSTIYGTGSERDQLGKRISEAMETIERKLTPVARLVPLKH